MADAATQTLERIGPLAAHRAVSVAQLGPGLRFSFRGDAAAAGAIGTAFGCTPPQDVCRAAVEGDHVALWLGPDEWLLLAPESEAAALEASLEASMASVPHSLVDVSHRNTGFTVMGEAAAVVLSVGCPLDFDLFTFPVGMCTRTVLGKAEVVLWRRGPQEFRLECWRSFAPYVHAFLAQAIENEAG